MSLEKTFMSLHENPPAGFNPDYRPGLAEELSRQHGIWCEKNPDVTREARKIAYRETHDRIVSQFPSVKELRDGQNE